MKFLIKLKKSVSIVTTLSLLISFVIGPTAANAMTNEEATAKYKQIFKDFMLPYSYGQITSAHYAGTDRVVINIQDLHCHPMVQRNIANIIETFDKSYGVNKVYLEGAYGNVDTSWINKKIQEYSMPDLLDKMLETGRLTGAEYYSALSGKNKIINGLEEKGPYLENLKRFGEIVENQEKINLILKAIDESMASLKKKYYTKRQCKLEELSNNYRTGKISSQKYYALLSKHTDKLGIDLSKYENTFTYIMLLELQKKLDYSKITNELQNLVLFLKESLPNGAYKLLADSTENFSKIDKLYGYIVRISRQLNLDLTANFPNLDNYFGYVEFSQKINPLGLVAEEKLLSQEINTRFSETKAQREVVFLINFGNYLKDYVTSKITSDDYNYYEKNIKIYKQLWNKYVDNRVLSLLDEYVAEADKFYKINNDRNIYFTNNMFKESDELNKLEIETEAKGDVNKIIENMKGVKEVDVVITGGFHSQTVTEILKNHGVSYIVITPNVTEGVKLAEETYYEIAREQSKISFQTLATLIASLSPKVQEQIFESIDVKNKFEEISTLSAEEKIKKLREIISAKLLESDDEGEVINEILRIIGEKSEINVSEEFLDKIGVEKFKELLNGDIDEIQNIIKILEENKIKQAFALLQNTIKEYNFYIENLMKIKEEEKNASILPTDNKVGADNNINPVQLDVSDMEESNSALSTISNNSPSTTFHLTMTWLSKLLDRLKITEFDKRQKIINIIENPIIVLSIFSTTVRKMFIRMHGNDNKKEVEQRLDYIFNNANTFVKEAVRDAIGMSFIEKIIGLVRLITRKNTRKDIAKAHTDYNRNEQEKLLGFSEYELKNEEKLTSLLENAYKYNTEQKNIIIKYVIDFIKTNTKKTNKKKMLEKLLSNVTSDFIEYFDKEQKNLIFDEIMKFIKEDSFLSNEEKVSFFERLSASVDKFDLEENRRDYFIDESFIFIKENEINPYGIIENFLWNIELFSQNKRDDILKFLLEKNILEKDSDDNLILRVLTKINYFSSEYKKDIFNFATEYFKKNTKKRVLDLMIDNMQSLDMEQKNEIYEMAINIANENKKILAELFEQKEYLNETQKKEVYNRINNYLLDYKNLSIQVVVDILEAIPYYEFINLDKDLKENMINAAIKVLEFEKEGYEYTTLSLLKLIFLRGNFLNNNQKNLLFNNIKNLANKSYFKDEKKYAFDALVFENIDLFSKEQKLYIEKILKSSYELDLVSKKIENITYSPLISKIKEIENRVLSKYKLKIQQDNQTDEKSIKLFQTYKELEAENLKTLKLLMNLSSKTDLTDVKNSLENMMQCYQSLVNGNKSYKLRELIDSFFKQDNIDIEKQRYLHGYDINTILEADLTDITINDLINVLHQTSINGFKEEMYAINKNRRKYSLSFQNFSKDKHINPEINKILSKIKKLDGLLVCFDEDTLVLSITPNDRHSTTIVVNTNNINRGIYFSGYIMSQSRMSTIAKMLEYLGFDAKLEGDLVTGKLDKNAGLSDDTDLAEKFDLLLKMFYLTGGFSDQVLNREGIESYTNKYAIATDNDLYNGGENLDSLVNGFYKSVRTGSVFNTKDNLNKILKNLNLPEISEDKSVLYEEPQTHIQVVGQVGINKYFNEVLDRAFCEGKIIVDRNGDLVKNDNYDDMKNIKDLLTDINGTRENEILRQASIIDELNKQNAQILKLETKAIVGQLEYQTGYLQLSTGDYLFVKVLKNSVNGMIRYAETELVSQNGQRVLLNSNLLLEKISTEGYKIYKNPRKKSKTEKETFGKELKGTEKRISNVSMPGRLMGGIRNSVVGKVTFDSKKVVEDQSILFKEYLSPDDMQGTLNAKGIILTSGMELSHQGLIVKEKGISASIISDVNIVERNGKTVAELKYMEYTGKIQNINGLEVEEIVEKVIVVNEGDEIAIDGETGRVIIFDKSVVNGTTKDKKKIAEYEYYKSIEKSASESKGKNIVQEKAEQVSEKQEISEKIEDNIKGFDEKADKVNFGTKATNLQEMYAMVSEMGKILGINVRVPYGIMIGAGAFLSILKNNEQFKKLFEIYEQAIRTGNKNVSEQTAKEIIKIIENLKDEDLKVFSSILTEKVNKAISDGYISENDKYAVRSSFKNEDGTKFSAAGVGESKVGVERDEIINTLINIVLTSVYGERSVTYQSSNRQEFIPAAFVQQAIDSEKSAVMMVRDGKISISGSLGQGEIVVSGEKTQSKIEIETDKDDSVRIFDYITERQDYQYGFNGQVKRVSNEDSTKEIFNTEEIEKLSKVGIFLREKYGYDADIEIAMKDGIIYVVQIRPITEKTEGFEDETGTQQIQEIFQQTEQITEQQEEVLSNQQDESSEEIEFKTIMELVKDGINPTKNIINFIEQFFDSQMKFEGNIVFVKKGQEIEVPENVKMIDYEIYSESNNNLRGGTIIGIINGKTIRAYKKGNSITFYSKQGLENISDLEIEDLFLKTISNGIKSDILKNGVVIAFATEKDKTAADIQNRLKNVQTDTIMNPVSLKFDLTEKKDDKEQKISRSICDGIEKESGIKTFMITQEQADEYAKEISSMEGIYTFVVVSSDDKDLEDKLNSTTNEKDSDFVLDISKENKTLSEMETLLEKLKQSKKESVCGIAATIYIKINSQTAENIKGINIYEKYGIIPIVAAKDISLTEGKKNVYNITDTEQIEN